MARLGPEVPGGGGLAAESPSFSSHYRVRESPAQPARESPQNRESTRVHQEGAQKRAQKRAQKADFGHLLLGRAYIASGAATPSSASPLRITVRAPRTQASRVAVTSLSWPSTRALATHEFTSRPRPSR